MLHRLIVAYSAGRKVDLPSILKHELMPVPLSLSETNGTLRSGDKHLLAEELTSGVRCPAEVELVGRSTLIIDGHALIQVLGKPTTPHTFGDLARIFVERVLQMGLAYDRIDITFDRYRD